ncbi:N-formylglutamate amidohydrolase [Nitratireductor alexandrii]|uniref:N-formylglutamate amidohydrolase n=1 Tax=Nitratireductor alexandrii TaxID=2448161 RepID=UPI000FD7241C|nr:N-formylglutamate amidohydrolase [Nitratireductor alexandrii]
MALSRHDQSLPAVDPSLISVADDFAGAAPFQTRRPSHQSVPFIFNSPHSGRSYPERFLALSRLDRQAIRRSEDCYVDELFAAAVSFGAPLLCANFPRAYLDVNREPWELDPRMFSETLPAYANIRSPRVAGGLGTVPRIVGEGQEIYAGKLPFGEARQRVETFYKPYHACLGRLLSETQAAFGLAVLIDCHSMPASIRVGEAGLRPDFIIGDRFNTSASAALSEAAIGILVSLGYTVAHNKPYAGGFITEHYGRPARGLHALQIEVNRGLYMNERSYRKSSGFLPLADDMVRFVERLIAAAGFGRPPMPLAAE